MKRLYKLAPLLLIVSCGMTIKHQVDGTVDVKAPTEYNINAKFGIDPATFEASCSQKFKDVTNTADRNSQIDQCIAANQAIVMQLINTLNGVNLPVTPTPGVP